MPTASISPAPLVITGTAADEALFGTAARDTLSGGAGNDTLEGGTQADVAVFSGNARDYQLDWRDGFLVVTDTSAADGDDGADQLMKIETLRFADGDLAVRPGGMFRINANSDGSQAQVHVAPTADGGFTVVWSGKSLELLAGHDVFLQRFDAAGAEVGVERTFLTSDVEQLPAIAELPDGRQFLTWSRGQYWESVGASWLDASGVQQGDAIELDASAAGNRAFPRIAVHPSGEIAIAWSGNDGTYLQRFENDGTPIGGELKITDEYGLCDLRRLDNGNLVVVWRSDPTLTVGSTAYARLLSADGVPIGGEIVLGTSAAGSMNRYTAPAITQAPDGGFIASWTQWLSTDTYSPSDVLVQRFAADGSTVGEQITVGVPGLDYNGFSVVGTLGDGGFIVAWHAGESGVSAIYAQRFDDDGTAVGEALKLSDSTHIWTIGAATPLVGGGFVLTWMGAPSGIQYPEVYSAVFDTMGELLLPQVRGTAGNDTLDLRASGWLQGAGAKGDDTYLLGQGDRVVEWSGGGSDTIVADFSMRLGAQVENLVLEGTDALTGSGNRIANTVSGNVANNTLRGFRGNDTLSGGEGADRLFGGAGNDHLTGDVGHDRFVFDRKLDASSNVDLLSDFASGIDKLALDSDVFSAFTEGSAVSAAQIRRGIGATEATTTEHRLIYDSATGALYYDPDGVDGAAAVQFAQLGADQHPTLRAADFVIVS